MYSTPSGRAASHWISPGAAPAQNALPEVSPSTSAAGSRPAHRKQPLRLLKVQLHSKLPRRSPQNPPPHRRKPRQTLHFQRKDGFSSIRRSRPSSAAHRPAWQKELRQDPHQFPLPISFLIPRQRCQIGELPTNLGIVRCQGREKSAPKPVSRIAHIGVRGVFFPGLSYLGQPALNLFPPHPQKTPHNQPAPLLRS